MDDRPADTHTTPADPSDRFGQPHRPTGLTEQLDRAMLMLDRWRERPAVVAGGSVALALVVILGWWLGRAEQPRPVEDLIPQVTLATTTPSVETSAPVVVHVAGAVASPGVYTLPPGSRVEDALAAAGGALVDSDLDQLNLAAPVPDGVQIRVPVVGEILSLLPALMAPEQSGPIDINRADAGRLEELPGIGPATAAAIVAWRVEHGMFGSVEGLLNVPGIGPAKLAAIADLAVAG